MSEAARSVEELAARVADGLPIDWGEAMGSTASDDDRAVVEQLRLMERVARFHVDAATAGSGSGDVGADPGVASVRPAIAGDAPLDSWGPLELRGRIGEGSFGELHRAWDPALDREVALKLLKRPASAPPSFTSVVVEEGRLLAKLRHPNVVTVHGADVHDGRVGLWMELVKGRSLERLLRDQGPMGAREAAWIGADLCRALAAVHGAGLVHRDVKAQNVLREEGGRIVLTDFGAGVEVREDGLDPGAKITGTPFYMAPELLRGAPATARSDLYALGVLLYRLVTGRFPVTATSWKELVARHERGEMALLRDVRPDLPEGFLAVVERATAPRVEDRFATAGQMEQALAGVAGTPSASAVAPPAPAHAGGSRRIAWLVGAGAILAAAAILLVFRERENDVAREVSSTAPAETKARAVAGQAATPSASATPSPAAYSVSAAVYRVAAGAAVRERLEPGARLALGDRITLEFQASAPLHVYVVNEDEAGHAYALFPLPGLDTQNPLAPGVTHVLPGARDETALSWTVDSPGGREHLLVLASPERLVEYESEMSALARPGQTAVTIPEEARLRLRGLGGLTPSPAARATPSAGRLFDMAQRLAARSEVVSGVWMRRIELENPRP